MTAEVKAKELVGQFYNKLPKLIRDYKDAAYELAVENALIAVDEIIDTVFTHKNSFDYWQSVKEEINKL